MKTLYNDLFVFVVKPDDPVSFCHLKVVKGTDGALILVSQQVGLDNQVAMGCSIGYAAEYLATMVVNSTQLVRREAKSTCGIFQTWAGYVNVWKVNLSCKRIRAKGTPLDVPYVLLYQGLA